MAINYTQTDTNMGGNNKTTCGGGIIDTASASKIYRIASDGGSAGSVAQNITATSSASLAELAWFTCSVNSGVSWNSGTWTWRVNVTSANMNITIEEVFLCRVDSAYNNQATIGSATGLGISCGSTGVKSGNITGSAQTPSAGDLVVMAVHFSNGAMTTQTIQVTPNQNIDSPFTLVTRTPKPSSIGHPFII